MTDFFPGTKVEYKLLPASNGSRFSPIFRRSGEKGNTLASVNAGDPGLYVGGGTINLRFANELGACAGAFQTIHAQAIKNARAGNTVTTSFDAGAPVVLVAVRLPGNLAAASAFPAETALLDIFSQAAVPHGEAANCAMLYVVPPNGRYRGYYATDEDFLAAVQRTAENAVALLGEYNASLIAANPKLSLVGIPTLRTCLFSGGQFRPRALQAADVAKAIFQGFARGLAASGDACGIDLIEFENGNQEFEAIAPQAS